MRKKILIAVLMCRFLSAMSASDIEIAKTYLKRAIINRDNPQISSFMIDKAGEYAAFFPECEFLLLENCRKTGNFGNAEKLVADMLIKKDKAFLIDDYDIDLLSAQIYYYLHSYKEALPFYKSVISHPGKRTFDNYLEYLSCAFLADAPAAQMLPVLREASSLFPNREIVFYQTLYSFKTGTTPFGEPIQLIRQLENNDYSVQEVQYLKSFLVKNEEELGIFIDDFMQIQDISPKWGRDIVYELLRRLTITDERILDNCLSLWEKYDGNNDVRTFRFLAYSPLADWIKSNEKFAWWADYTGKRTVDTDNNGRPELVVEVKNGIVINRSEDKNQDGISETEFDFYDNGKIDKIYIREDNENFWCYDFNQYDGSLLTVENVRAGKLVEKNVMRRGAFVFNESMPYPVLQDLLVDFREEYRDGEVLRSKFSEGKIVMQEKDSDGDGFFEYCALFNNGVISEAFIDMDKDGVPELHEIYDNGKLVQCESGYSNTAGVYYYKEMFANNTIEKYWDNNRDLKYEILEKTLPSGVVQMYFDSDNDGVYDYMHEKNKDGTYDVYELNSDGTKKRRIAAAAAKQRTVKMKNWTVVSSRNADLLPIPDEINFFDTQTEGMSGFFLYKNRNFYFSDGLLESPDFSFRLLRNGERLFLFDCGA